MNNTYYIMESYVRGQALCETSLQIHKKSTYNGEIGIDSTNTRQCCFKSGAKTNHLNICTLLCNTTFNLYNVSYRAKRL